MNHTPEAFKERLFHQNERVMKFGLDAMQRALVMLGVPSYPTILIAGTNGKGQVSATLSTISHQLGYHPGLFTSPHLIDFSERIRVDGHRIEASRFYASGWHILETFGGTDDAAENERRRAKEASLPPALTYFECCFAMAIDLFRDEKVDMGIFEVGLGGRLDATNVLSPDISIITSISLDHEQYLGHTPDAIAHEKAGIMRAGKPVIVGRQCHEVLMHEAQLHGCSAMYALGRDFDWRRADDGHIELLFDQRALAMPGAETMADYQRDNAAIAFFAAHIAHETGVFAKDPFIAPCEALMHTRWVGRMYAVPNEIARQQGVLSIIMDGAHNPDGVRRFCEAVAQYPAKGRELIVNSCADKGIDAMFPQYLQVFQPDQIFVTPVSNPRLMTPEAYCARTGLEKAQACSSLPEAFARAARCVGQNGIIFVSGSLYLIGEALTLLGDETALDSIEI